jgi:hypothetical protein
LDSALPTTPTSPESRRARGRLARLTRSHGPDDPAVADARREFESERFADHVRAIDDPAVLHRAAQIVRAALARQRAAEIGDEPTGGAA